MRNRLYPWLFLNKDICNNQIEFIQFKPNCGRSMCFPLSYYYILYCYYTTTTIIKFVFFYIFRCSHVTDIGVGYLSTMSSLLKLFLRWCTQIRDFGLQHMYSMKNLRVLSLAGTCFVSLTM